MPPVRQFVSRQPHLAAFEKEASKCPPARVSQGSSDDVSCREMARFSKSREERHAWSGRYATEAHDPPPRTGRTEREHVASWFGVNPTTGSGTHSRQLGNNSAKVCHDRPQGAALLPWVAEVVGAGEAVGRASRAATARGDRRGACRAVGEETPWDTVSLRHPAPRSPFVRRVLGAHRGIGGGAVTSGGEGVGPSFVPCRMGGVRLRSHRVNKFSPKFQLLPRISSLLKFVAHVMRLTVSLGKRSMKHSEFVDLEVSGGGPGAPYGF